MIRWEAKRVGDVAMVTAELWIDGAMALDMAVTCDPDSLVSTMDTMRTVMQMRQREVYGVCGDWDLPALTLSSPEPEECEACQ